MFDRQSSLHSWSGSSLARTDIRCNICPGSRYFLQPVIFTKISTKTRLMQFMGSMFYDVVTQWSNNMLRFIFYIRPLWNPLQCLTNRNSILKVKFLYYSPYKISFRMWIGNGRIEKTPEKRKLSAWWLVEISTKFTSKFGSRSIGYKVILFGWYWYNTSCWSSRWV